MSTIGALSQFRTKRKKALDLKPSQKIAQTKIVLVAPPSPYSPHYMRLPHPPFSLVSVFDVNPLIPLGVAYVAAALERMGFMVNVVDLTFQSQRRVNIDRVQKSILDLNPDVVGFSSFTSTIPTIYRVAEALKRDRRSLPLIIGGPHASALPQRTLEECPSLDAAVIGEGEAVFPDFLRMRVQKMCSEWPLAGIVYRRDDGSILGDSQPVYVEDLDALPFPARHLFNLEKYKTSSSQVPTAQRHPIASIITSRGCPHGCRFCFHSGGWRYRTRSPDNVVREIEHLWELGFREIQVFDDNFTQNRTRVIEICKLINKRGIDMSFCLPNGVRVDTVDEATLSAMYAVGFYSIHFGVESGDETILKRVGKGVTVDQVKRAVCLAKKVGFRVSLYLIVGLPGSTVESMERSLKLVKESGTDHVTAFLFTPYPGSEYWCRLAEHLEGIPWERYNDGDISNPIYVPEGLDAHQLQLWCSEINKLSEV